MSKSGSRSQPKDLFRQEAERTQKYLDVVEAIVVVLNSAGHVTLINRKGCTVLGYEQREILGKKWFDLCLPEAIREEVRAVFQKLMAGETAPVEYYENPVLTKSGAERLIAWHNTVLTDEDGRITSTLSSGEDSTDRRQAQKALRASKEQYRRLFTHSPFCIHEIDTKGRLVSMNPAGLQMLGVEAEEDIIGMPFLSTVAETDRERIGKLFRTALKGQSSEFEFECVNGGFVHSSFVPISDSAGSVLRLMGLTRDITEQKRADEALRESEQRNQAVVDNIVEGIVTIDQKGVIQSFNPASERIFGHTADEVLGQNVSILMPEPDRRHHDDYLRSYLEGGAAKIIGIGREVVGRRKDGNEFPMYLGVGEILSGQQRVFVGSVRDLTETKQLQEELLKTRNLAALGEMAASIAHQVKNPLAAISGVIDVLEDRFVDQGPYHQVIKELSDRVHRLDDSIKRLLEFSKPLTPQKHPHNLRDIVESAIAASKREKAFARIHFHLDGNKQILVPVDAVLFEQVLLNLLDNAARAMRDGGEIRFELSETLDGCSLRIADTGSGIPPDSIEKLCHPFFTMESGGTGLGLAISKKIMDAHEGSIAFSSELGSGTEVTLRLPKEDSNVG